MDDKLIRIEVVYALPKEQRVVELFVPEDTDLRSAARRSGLDSHFPGLDLKTAPLGVFGKVIKNPETVFVRENDRIEIYRPLIADPKQVRARRAAQQTGSP